MKEKKVAKIEKQRGKGISFGTVGGKPVMQGVTKSQGYRGALARNLKKAKVKA